jgi:Leucine-rich repeat (LRR) protein
LGRRNITQLAGFERLVNLEVLWVHDNQLRAINCLDHNTRIKQLCAHNNKLCTLKGSLTQLKFLTHLDISHNQLKRLDKVVGTLQRLRFLQELNLQVRGAHGQIHAVSQCATLKLVLAARACA